VITLNKSDLALAIFGTIEEEVYHSDEDGLMGTSHAADKIADLLLNCGLITEEILSNFIFTDEAKVVRKGR
jgi:hypothetical protein